VRGTQANALRLDAPPAATLPAVPFRWALGPGK
jgi:hypothetical protein